MRQTIRLLQEARRKAGLSVSDRSLLGLQTSGVVLEALKTHCEMVKSEVLATEVCFEVIEAADYSETVTIHDTELRYWIMRSI